MDGIGGEKEQLMTKPNEQKIYIKHRKGFIKLALQFGAHLVPMVSLYSTTPSIKHSHLCTNNGSLFLVLFWGK